MGSGILALDTILSATQFFVGKWSPDLKGNQSRDALRFLLCRLYDKGRGQLMNAQLPLAQTTLANKLDLSRQWVGELVGRLRDAGWIDYYSPKLGDGTNGSTVFRIGPQLKRLLITLIKSRPIKKPMKSAANNRWQFSPSKEEKKPMLTHERENRPLEPQTLDRIPLLRQWLERGKTDIV